MIGCLLEGLLGILIDALVRIILWPVWLVVLAILATPYALIGGCFDRTGYWPAVRERYRRTLLSWGGLPWTN